MQAIDFSHSKSNVNRGIPGNFWVPNHVFPLPYCSQGGSLRDEVQVDTSSAEAAKGNVTQEGVGPHLSSTWESAQHFLNLVRGLLGLFYHCGKRNFVEKRFSLEWHNALESPKQKQGDATHQTQEKLSNCQLLPSAAGEVIMIQKQKARLSLALGCLPVLQRGCILPTLKKRS